MSYPHAIGHKQKQHYPDMQLIRRQAKHVCLAVQKLAGLGIEVQVIHCKAHTGYRGRQLPQRDGFAWRKHRPGQP